MRVVFGKLTNKLLFIAYFWYVLMPFCKFYVLNEGKIIQTLPDFEKKTVGERKREGCGWRGDWWEVGERWEGSGGAGKKI